MSLDFYLYETKPTEVFTSNITHNLGKMADEAGIYKCLWRPDEIGITKASEMVDLLRVGLKELKRRPEHFKKFDSENGWGIYEHFVPFVEEVLNACELNPDAQVKVSR